MALAGTVWINAGGSQFYFSILTGVSLPNGRLYRLEEDGRLIRKPVEWITGPTKDQPLPRPRVRVRSKLEMRSRGDPFGDMYVPALYSAIIRRPR